MSVCIPQTPMFSKDKKPAVYKESYKLMGVPKNCDNAPHEKWKTVSTFPKHCHDGSESNVVSSKIPDDPSAALKYFLQRVKEKILQFKVQT